MKYHVYVNAFTNIHSCAVFQLINTAIEELEDKCRILFQLRVNPRNINSLINTVVLVCIPNEYDGEHAQVSSVGRSIGKGVLESNWSGDITRIFSWRIAELYSGAVCEFEALFPLLNDTKKEVATETPFAFVDAECKCPILVRYDCDESLLSDIELDAPVSAVKRKFRVYHREV